MCCLVELFERNAPAAGFVHFGAGGANAGFQYSIHGRDYTPAIWHSQNKEIRQDNARELVARVVPEQVAITHLKIDPTDTRLSGFYANSETRIIENPILRGVVDRLETNLFNGDAWQGASYRTETAGNQVVISESCVPKMLGTRASGWGSFSQRSPSK